MCNANKETYTPEPKDIYRDLLFDVRRSVRYHIRRQKFFRNFHRIVLFSSLILGSWTLVALAEAVGTSWPLWLKVLPAAIVSVLAGIDLVAMSTEKSWQHSNLARQFIKLERRMVSGSADLDEELIRGLEGKRLKIEAAEPPVLRVLDTLCYNEMKRAMGYKKDEMIEVSILQRLCAPFFDLSQSQIHSTQNKASGAQLKEEPSLQVKIPASE